MHMCVLSHTVKSEPTLCNPVDCSLQGCFAHGIFQAGILEWVAISYSGNGSSEPRDLPNLRIEPTSLVSPTSSGRFIEGT